jgi:hypothetical protein
MLTPDDYRIREAAKIQEQTFINVMTEVQKLSKPKLASFDIASSHNWEEVLNVADASAQAYTQRAKGIKGIFRRVGRKIGEANPAIDPVLDVLPTGEYTSLVCGGLVPTTWQT